VATQLIRGLQLGVAGRRSGGTINFRGRPRRDQDNANDVHAAKSQAKCALKDNLLTSVGTATLSSYSDDITVSNRA